jgi:ankyrin repeat protein
MGGGAGAAIFIFMNGAREQAASPAWEAFRKTMATPQTLWQAAKEDDVDGVIELIAGGADLEAHDPRGYSPLMLAAYSGSARAFDVLLELGADPNTCDGAGNSVLMGAAFKGHGYMVERLVAAGADPLAKNGAGLDASGFAAMFGRTDMVELLRALQDKNGDNQ